MKTDPRVDAYIQAAGSFAQPILRRLRELVHQNCPDVEETMKWSHPHFLLHGKMFCGLAAFKAHCTFGFWHQGMEKLLQAEGRATGEAMGLLGKLSSLKDVPTERDLRRYLKAAAELNESETPARPKPVKKLKTELVVPDDLAAALKKNKTAAQTFEAFSYSHRKEYLEWIAEAKRPETRAKRVATTLEWLTEGKARHWKYANC